MGHISSRDAYKNLEDRINWFTQGAPVSDTLYQILQVLYTEEEAFSGSGAGGEKQGETGEGRKRAKKKAVVNTDICLGCGVCARNCPTKAIELQRRPVQVITPVNSTHRFVLQAIEKGTLQNLIFDNQAFANHRAMAAVFSVILDLPPLKQALASKQFKSIYLDKLLSSQMNKKKKQKN